MTPSQMREKAESVFYSITPTDLYTSSEVIEAIKRALVEVDKEAYQRGWREAIKSGRAGVCVPIQMSCTGIPFEKKEEGKEGKK